MLYKLIFTALAISFTCLRLSAQTLEIQKETVNVGPNPSFITAVDLNDDGKIDFITADRGNLSDPREERPANDEISILYAGENNTEKWELNYKKLQPSLKTGFAPYYIATANIDALKWPDIIVVNFMAVRNYDLTLFRNLKQDNIFEPHHFNVDDTLMEYYRHSDGAGAPVFHPPGFSSLAIHDFNGDGLRDAVVCGWSSDVLCFFMGDAQEYFSSPQIFNIEGAPRDLQVRDFNSDGIADIAILLYATSEISFWIGNEEGDWKESNRIPTRGVLPVRLLSEDINGDGLYDLAVTHSHSEDSVVFFYNDSNMAFSLSQEILLGENRSVIEHGLRDCTAGDFNGDGRQDFAVTCAASEQVKVLLNTANDTSKLPVFSVEEYSFPETPPRAICASDINNDGKDDLAVTLWGKNAVSWIIAK